MDGRRQHNGIHSPLQSQQYPPLFQQGSGQSPRLPLPLPPPNVAFSPRPPSFSGPLAGQKRSSRFSDSGGCTKLFVASLPRNITEDEVRELFGGFGNVLEVIFLKDKKTGLPQGCCFIKYANVSEAERAIRVLDNQRTLPGGPAPLQVKLADDGYDRFGHTEYKLFVGSLNRQAGEEEIEKIFGPYGRVENVYIIRDEHKQSRGCAFVTFPERDMAIAAISALNGTYKMAGCHQPIIVRFADPKRPRSGERETRMGAIGTEVNSRSHRGVSGMNYNTHSGFSIGGSRDSGIPATDGYNASFGLRHGAGASIALSSQAGILPSTISASAPAKTGHLDSVSSALVSHESSGQPPSLQQLVTHQYKPNASQANQWQATQGYPLTQSTDVGLQQHVSTAQFTSSKPTPQTQIYSQPPVSQPLLHQPVVSSMQRPVSLAASQPLQHQPSHAQDSQGSQQVQSSRNLHQTSHILPSQPLHPQLSKENPQQSYIQPVQMMSHLNQPNISQPSGYIPVQQTTPSQQQQVLSVPQHPVLSQSHTVALQQQPGPSQQQVTPVQTALPLQQLLSAQQHPTALQPQAALSQQLAGLSQQQASPLQQQAVPFHQQAVSLQQANVFMHQQAASLVATTASVSAEPATTLTSCDWTEHTSPEGHKYYYNSITGESRWEKPVEFAAFEKQRQQLSILQTQQQQQQQQQQSQFGQAPQVNLQFHQQPPLSHQSHHGQPYQQQPQPQMQQQQLPHLQQLPQPQQAQQQLPQPQQAQQQVQYSQNYSQHHQREAHLNSPIMYSQVPSSGAHQVIQGYTHLQQPVSESTSQSVNRVVDASKTMQIQQTPSNQQISAVNGVVDATRVGQWMPTTQQGSLHQDWIWNTKAAGP